MTHTTSEPHEAGAAAVARQAALVAAHRYTTHRSPGAARSTPVDVTIESVAELRIAVEEYVSALRAAGRPPETAVVLVKQVIAEVDASLDDSEILRRDAVRWAIEAYYAP
jgi:hypothetical protein